MRLGVHLRTSKGLKSALETAERLGCESAQFFSSNPNSWIVSNLDLKVVESFRAGIERLKIHPVVLHTPYLLNLASSKEATWENSRKALATALDRANIYGAAYVVTHIGSHGGDGFEVGVEKIKDAVRYALDNSNGNAMVLLESAAGAGNTVGSTLEELAGILERLQDEKERVGICLDTAHLWGAGYDISTKDRVDEFLHQFDIKIGLSRLKLMHCNDTQKPLGSHADRHWHIGQGQIGIEGFKALADHPALTDLGGILETPDSENGYDKINLDTIRGLKLL